jgi:hypothetical protein
MSHGKPWFSNKRYGYGLTPSSWQGVVALATYIVALTVGLAAGDRAAISPGLVVIYVVAISAALVWVTWAKSDRRAPLKWRWGRDPDS